MKPVRLRPKAREDRKNEILYYRSIAGTNIAENSVRATRLALKQIEQEPGMGSPRLGQLADIPGLRSWRVNGFSLVWLYFEHDDHLDVIRLLGERQDILTMLGAEH
ncbi:MAG: type II toxin-antitoxin system RelE/ParE family toxin [Gammaproteobacteria bacterium]|uniref:type II toxin-antitoxin system RelE/ParE family toxin n=1 Tax=Rhodoferax sp. TaxID=50421 RepID=UPI0017A3D0C3|nr:type II toxin-antitoxin system RelE/ParE family toxin [Rhodoferax sp.]MBU3900265.1 type II toxin-antitoxin system RelE/ParE family toxin [Gammaproteobacteria bacterium]MBA3057902.1 type II toxin-antitoxin system RelE/ParE family toxin [Rhodoferax sp.]MBU3997949.1 type II toxin-antitoxin system RelE/ParE family toxin [Gammaproteobacteria bacterium]MBU4079397.1 type II toxin-antitoxin system RelE/ParE family toxin [Gammaproteobacteria bacterium]MBU4111699.1 type II toxin-antitoxin system RelE